MANRWGIPKDVEDVVRKRDAKCVYCGLVFLTENKSPKDKPSWEHIVNDIRINGTICKLHNSPHDQNCKRVQSCQRKVTNYQ